jgi:hypothetical protein
MQPFHGLPDLHTELFKDKSPISVRLRSSRIVPDTPTAAGNLITSNNGFDDPPPLTVNPQLPSTRHSAAPRKISRNGRSTGACNSNEMSVYDHHCKFSFMRSQLSRILCDSDVGDTACISALADPHLSDFISLMTELDNESADRLLNFLKLRIRNS